MDREGKTQVRHSQVQQGMVRLSHSTVRMQAGHGQSRQELLCILADLAGHSSAPAPLAPEPPAHFQTVRGDPAPDQFHSHKLVPQGLSPLAWPAPSSPSPCEELRRLALPHCPPLRSTQPQHSPAAQAPSWGRPWTIGKEARAGQGCVPDPQQLPKLFLELFSCPGSCGAASPELHHSETRTGQG